MRAAIGVLACVVVAACSLANAPEEAQDPAVSPTTSTSASSGAGGSGGGGGAECGDGVEDPGETCDPPASCPTSCDDGDACTIDALEGSAAACTAACVTTAEITECVAGDGCCPAGCSLPTDPDCAVCGDSVIEGPETCDPPGSCPIACDDGDLCTNEVLLGSPDECTAECEATAIDRCIDGDGCCPTGCTFDADDDCGGRVLVIHAGPAQYGDDIQAKLVSTGAFELVDVVRGNMVTPTLAELLGYSVILVTSDASFIDPVVLGNNVADYFDQGGRVVVATFANDPSIGIQGRFGDLGQGYLLLDKQPQEQPPDSLGTIHEPASPLVAGVSTFTAQSAYRSAGLPLPNTVVVAEWASGKPLVVRGVVAGRARADLNFYPPSEDASPGSGFWVGDGALLMRNALLFQE